ncbi:hypothetical protein LWP59_25195 [Amycolatopsis acidiphila]|uniref:Uncharacterized protein n=1 Tax=Amycolatopsis acidiphila TaxID=715473 RepID=A0A558ALC4_9PSEU|nr:hypothetical protein [Amycolatopsis acidiphila]TVT25054.1 hypothetical protein FNH06_04345 [Amycolatopsis acidiphila]UIJ57436.1 hypothetical protein LWP59_25195 [Amycolatopsis acidiphila]GHG84238.1 hypothetical protein GCM10017788_55970 [Amycolatopsis acidiphila]
MNEPASDRFFPGELTTVTGRSGTLYLCPDTSTVDHHIARLYRRIEHTAAWRHEVLEKFWADIDLLLDRRIWLEMTALTATR